MANYGEFINTEIPWIGEIPSHWRVMRGKTILTLLSRPASDDDEIITCFRDGEVTLRKNRREDGFTVSLQEIGYQGIEPGDLVVHGMDGFAGAIGISDSRGKSTPVLNVMDSAENKRFLMYYLRAAAYKDVFMSLSTGIRVRSCDLRWNKLSVFPFVLPTMAEQSQIVAFLDHNLEEIDTLIKEAKASIEEYKAWKASIIYEAVTKGLDPNVEMKESGVQFIGLIPESWDVVKFKRIASVEPNLISPEGYDSFIQIAPDCIEKGSGRLVKERSVEDAGVVSWNQLFKKGQILYSKIRPVLNKVIIAPFNGLCSADMYPISTRINTEFLLYSMLSQSFVGQVDLITRDRVKMPKINQDELGSVMVAVPPTKEEQRQIAEMICIKTAEIDAILREKEALVLELERYKKSLIFEVVTGKRRVC